MLLFISELGGVCEILCDCALIGGGLRKTELVLLGGAQGIGKTIATLQIARNVAMRNGQFAFYLSYEHTETHLMNRLLCMESINKIGRENV